MDEFLKNLIDLEQQLQHDEAIKTDKLINALNEFSKVYRKVDLSKTENIWREICSSLTVVLTHWTHSNSKITRHQILQLLRKKIEIITIFKAGYDPLQNGLLRKFRPEAGYLNNDIKLLLMISINSLNDELFNKYKNTDEVISFFLAIGWLSERAQLTKSAKLFHSRLIKNFERFKGLTLPVTDIHLLARPYMYVTYSSSKNKDSIKVIINEIIVRSLSLQKYNRENISNEMKSTKKKKILFIHEVFSDTHAMMRCFVSIYEQLESDFDVYHLVWEDQDLRVTSRKLKNILRTKRNLGNLIDVIRGVNADVIIYPSIAFSIYIISVSNIRLAPLQLQLFGHPSPSFSSEIDGSLSITKTKTGYEKNTSYNVFHSGSHIAPYLNSSVNGNLRSRKCIEANNKLNIAINGKIMKLAPQFIDFLSSITWPENTKLNFFPDEIGVDHLACKNLIERIFPGSRVFPRTNYEDFMQNLARQDLALCPFPFGNTNGIMDCIMLGLPTFVLKESELCNAFENQFLNKLGLSTFIAPSEEKLKEMIERFLNDDAYMQVCKTEFTKKCEEFISNNDSIAAAAAVAQKHVEWIVNQIDR